MTLSFKGIFVNQACPFINEGSFEITMTVSLSKEVIYSIIIVI